MLLDEAVERDGSAGGALQLRGRAVLLDVEVLAEFADALIDLFFAYALAQCAELIHLEHLDVAAEGDGDLRDVGGDVEHAAVVVAEEAEVAIAQDGADLGGGEPFADLGPCCGIVEEARDLMKGDSSAREDVGDLRHGTGGAVGKPVAGHAGAVGQAIELGVVDCGAGLQVENENRDSGLLSEQQDSARKRVGGDVEDQEVGVGGAALTAGFARAGGGVDEAERHELYVRGLKLLACAGEIAFELRAQTVELLPVGFETDAAERYAEMRFGRHIRNRYGHIVFPVQDNITSSSGLRRRRARA